jgi:hypothetical protein
MQRLTFTVRCILFFALASVLFAAPGLLAENRIMLDCPVAVPSPDGDSVPVYVYYGNDVELGGLSIGFHYDSDDIECTSVDYSQSYWMSNHGVTSPVYRPEWNMVLVGWFDFTAVEPIPPQDSGLFCILWFQVPAGTTPQCVNIDSTFVPPAGEFIFSPAAGGQLTPNYYDCSTGDMNIGNMPDCYAPVVDDIPDQILAEGTPFATISLDDYVYDESNPDNQLDWTFSGNVELNVWIDGSRVAHIEAPNPDWNGSETVTFTATDPNGLFGSDDATFAWTPVNDPPVVSGIPDQTIDEGESFIVFDLDTYVTDVDNDTTELNWSSSGNVDLGVSIDGDHKVTIMIPNPDWYGQETITFTATDPGSESGSDAAVFTVNNINDPPVVGDIPNQTIAEGGSFATIPLDDYVEDVDNDDSEMDWTWTGNSELDVSIDGNRVATIVIPHPDWFGTETITFTATDPGSDSDSDPATFEVTNVPDDPVAPDTSVVTDEDVDLVSFLPGYDVDLEPLTWAIVDPPDNGTIDAFDPATGAYTYNPNDEYSGPDAMTYEVSDSRGIPDTGTVNITVTEVNDAPVVGDIPGQIIAEGSSFATFDLDDYVTDVDHPIEQIDWSYSGNSDLGVSIDGNNVVTITVPDPDWFGDETITFTATDPGDASDSDPATFEVTNIPDDPVARDTSFTTDEDVNMVKGLPAHDVDNDPLTYTVTAGPNHGSLASFDPNTGIFTYDPDLNYFGPDTLYFVVDDGTKAESDTGEVAITVTAVNDPPVVIDPDDQTVPEGGAFTTFDLDDLVSDVDNNIEDMTWTHSGDNELTVSIDGENVVTIGIPHADWYGQETITFRATDPGDAFGEGTATYTVTPVNDAPVVSDIPGQTIQEGGTFTTFDLDPYVTDIDDPDAQIDWTYSGNVDLSVSIDANHVVTIQIPDINWFGSETITFTATDTAGASDGDDAVFLVEAVNDPPVVSDIPDQSLNQQGEFDPIDLNLYVDDVEDDDLDIDWTYSGNVELIVTIDENNIAHVELPSPSWFGVETIVFRANDTGGLFDEDAAEFSGLLCGDVNGDGLVNVSDIVYLLYFIFDGGPPPVVWSAGDVNCDQVINVTDLVIMINYVFGAGPAPCSGC